jgi:uncharacterized protein YcnI
MYQTSTVSRRLRRLAVGLGLAIAVPVLLPSIASAHVEIEPGTVEGGDFTVIAVRVPNERDNASTTKLQLTLPAENPIGSVQTTDLPGWKVSTATRKLAAPIDLFGRKIDTVVSDVTWTATDGTGIRPGQYKDFNLSLGPLPKSGELVFRAVQTYSSGEKVNWNEVSADKSVEPEHPAPVLAIAPAAAETNAPAPSSASGADGTTPKAAAASPSTVTASNNDTSGAISIGLSGAALVVSLLAAGLAWRRGRTAHPSHPDPSRRAMEQSSV